MAEVPSKQDTSDKSYLKELSEVVKKINSDSSLSNDQKSDKIAAESDKLRAKYNNKWKKEGTIEATKKEIAKDLAGKEANKQNTVMSDKSDPLAAIKNHPLYADWRNIEDMEFPPKKIKAPKEDKDATENAEGKEKKESWEKTEEKKPEKESEKKKKWRFSRVFRNPDISYNPLSRAWNRGKSLVSGTIAVPGRVVAKAAHIVGRPQQLFEWDARSDMAKNTGRGFANFFRGITGAIYKPHRMPLAYENVFKDYGAGRWPQSTKNLPVGERMAKGFCRSFGKFCCPIPFIPIPKVAAHVVQAAWHFLADTASWQFDYTHTSNAIKKAVSLDYVIPSAKSDTKVAPTKKA